MPFCRHRCGYCNFTLVAGRDDLIGGYLEALERELAAVGHPCEVDTLFLGGGTPTHLGADELQQLLALVGRWLPLAARGEFSVEANPSDLEGRKAAVLQRAGVNRVSLGVQSFAADKLRVLERDHNAQQVATAAGLVREIGAALAIDLIFGAPDETLNAWEGDLAAAIAMRPEHVSTYGLTFEKGTSFWSRKVKGELRSAEEDEERAMYEAAIERLQGAGYEHYEVSNFARRTEAETGKIETFRCRHNENYWLGGAYLAFGPGAARFVGGRREMNHRSTTTYIRRMLAGESPVAETEELGSEDAARERLVFGLRRLEGLRVEAFAAQTGYRIEELGGEALDQFLQLGLLEIVNGYLRLTRGGLMVSDAIWSYFLKK